MAKVKKYLPGAESLGTSFGDKAGAFMGNYGGAIGSAASSLMPLLMKKPDPNAKPYKKGSKLIKYRKGGKDLSNLSLQDSEELVKGDLLSNKDNFVSKLPKFAQKAFAKKAMSRIEQANKEYNDAYKDVYSNKEVENTPFEENRVMRQIVKKRQNSLQPQVTTPTVETPKEDISLLNTPVGPRENATSPTEQKSLLQIRDIESNSQNERDRVRNLQKKLGVKADGIWGPKTQAAWEASKKRSTPLVKNNTEEDIDIPDLPKKNTQPIQQPNLNTQTTKAPVFNRDPLQGEGVSGGGFQDYRTDSQKGLNLKFSKNNKNEQTFGGFKGGQFGGAGASGSFKTGTKNLNSNMKRKKYDDGVEGISNNPRFQQMMSNDIRKTSTGLTPSSAYGTTSSAPAKKPLIKQKPVMTAEMQKVAKLQQKMKAAGYNIKVDGSWGAETQKIYDAYNKDKSADVSRKNNANTGQGPTVKAQRDLTPLMQGKTLPEVTVTAPSKNTYNPLDSPVLRGASADTQARMNREQAVAEAKRKAREAEIAKNSQSLPSNTSSNRLTFNASDRGQGQDFTTAQDNALKQNKLVGDGATSKNSTRVKYDFGTSAAKLFGNAGRLFSGSSASDAVRKMPSKLPSKVGSVAGNTLRKPTVPQRFKTTPVRPTMPVDNRPGMEAIRNYKPAMAGRGMPKMGVPTMPKLMFADGAKKLSGYSKLDTKLGGILPGGVTRAEARAAKAAKKAIPTTNVGPMAGGYQSAPAKTTGVGPLAGGLSTPAPDLTKPVGPMTDIGRYTKADNMPAPAKKSLKSQYEENKGGYSRALKSGKKDSSGNLVDPNTGLAYKQLPARTRGTGGTGGSKPATTAPKGSNLFKNGVAVKNFKDKNTGITYYTNGRAFDEKTGKMAKYAHNPKSNKIGIQFDKAKAAPVKKRKGDDTYMDEVIDTGSRIAGSIGGGLLAGGTTFGVGSVAGAVAGDYAGKKFGNWLNKKLGYREEDDESQEGYSLKEGALAGAGGAAGKLVKFAAPVLGKVGGAIVSRGGKELAKVSGAPLGRALSFASKSKAGQVVSNVAGKAKNLVSKGSGSNTAAAQTTSKVASKVNAPGAMSKVAPTAQSSRAVGNLGKVPTKAVRGTRGRFTKNPANTPAKNATANPQQLLTKRGATSPITAKPTATTQAAQTTAKTSVSKTQAAARLARQKGKKAINFVKNNKKKTAAAVGATGVIGAGLYGASKMKTGE